MTAFLGDLSTPLLIIFSIGIIILLFVGISYLYSLIKRRVVKTKEVNQHEESFVIKDTQITMQAKHVKEATGAEINRPAELSNVSIDLTAEDVNKATGLKSNQSLYAGTVMCSCGKTFSIVRLGGKPSSMVCPHCGKEYK